VECVINAPHSTVGVSLNAGALYRIRELWGDGQRIAGEPASVALEEVRLPVGPKGFEATWNLRRFRPVYRPRADLIETLLQPVDGVSPELETA